MLLLRIKGKESEYKISDITSLATMIALNTMALEVVSKIPDITNLSTKTAFNTKAAVLKKIPDAVNFLSRLGQILLSRILI